MKPNFGHTEGASGIAGFIKTVMVLENGTIPPIANLEVLNPRMQAHLWNMDVSRSWHAIYQPTDPQTSSFERPSNGLMSISGERQ
jgi:acyl transferase domain-containing protein